MITKEVALKDLEYSITMCKEQEAKNKGVMLRHAYIDLLPNVRDYINQEPPLSSEVDKALHYFNFECKGRNILTDEELSEYSNMYCILSQALRPKVISDSEVEEVYLITQCGKYLKTYNEFGYIEETINVDEAQLFECGDSDIELYKDEEGWSWKDEPLLALNEDEFEIYCLIIKQHVNNKQSKLNKINAIVTKADEIGLDLIYYSDIKQILKEDSVNGNNYKNNI